MPTGQSKTPERGGVGAQLVGDQQFRHDVLLLEQLAHQPQRAARPSRRRWTSISRTSPSTSTARQRYVRLPAMRTTMGDGRRWAWENEEPGREAVLFYFTIATMT